jgi:lipopolysaccharide export system ATP-binding protein
VSSPKLELPTAPAVLSVHELSVSRGGTSVVRDVSLKLQMSEIVGVLGPSGAGKSTLFAALAGELPSRGEIVVAGEVLTALPTHARARRGLSYLPQGPSVLHDLSARDNLATFASLALGRRSAAAIDLDLALERVNLLPRAHLRARDLSGGERRRLELARATLLSPRVLLADEPFAGMDPHSVQEVANLLRQLAIAGLAILVSDHRAHEVLTLASRALLLVDGAVQLEATPAAFLEHPLVTSRYLAALPAPAPHG